MKQLSVDKMNLVPNSNDSFNLEIKIDTNQVPGPAPILTKQFNDIVPKIHPATQLSFRRRLKCRYFHN